MLVTGGTRGIGLASVQALDARGFRVFAGYRTDADGRRLAALGSPRVTPVRLDVTDPHDVTQAMARVADATGEGGLWGLVNNAGIVVAGPLEALPLHAVRQQFEVNVLGVIAVTQTALPLLRRAGGRIVNISSVNGRLASPWSGVYAASKHALEAISDAWRVELARWHIALSVIQPGAIRTDIWDTSRERAVRISDEFTPASRELYRGLLERLGRVQAPGRAISPDRVARRVVHALTARRPRVRYVVGLDARIGLWLKALLPARWLDRILGARRAA